MRSGTHYVLDALSQVYHGQIARIQNGDFVFVSQEENARGLYERNKEKQHPIDKSLIFQTHYYHTIPNDDRLQGEKIINLIGYPFDSFFSDGLIFSNNNCSVVPSIYNKNSETYTLKHGSKEWYFLKPYMQKNAEWLSSLCRQSDLCILRYEDFFNDFDGTCKKIIKLAGPFFEKFPEPMKNNARLYWRNSVKDKMDKRAFEALCEIFSETLEYFWPEKKPFEYL